MMKARTKGVERMRARLGALPGELEAAVGDAAVKGAGDIADMARILAPKDTGALAESIHVTPGGRPTPRYSQPGNNSVVPDNAAMVTAGNTDVRYAHLVEYGTPPRGDHPGTPAQPFFWPAYRLLRKKVTRRINSAVGKALRGEAGIPARSRRK